MNEGYSDNVAAHYRAYRPPLHAKIIREALGESRFAHGLDIGCGTGVSSKALLKFCERVTGIEPSADMLKMADATESITYLWFDGHRLPFERTLFDIATFAGSLFYIDRQQVFAELRRVLKNNACILVYDFDIRIDRFLEKSGLPMPATHYDHSVSFDSIRYPGLIRVNGRKDEITLSATYEQIAHLLLSDSDFHEELARAAKYGDLFSGLVGELEQFFGGSATELPVITYFTRYQLQK